MKRTVKLTYTIEIKKEWDGAKHHYQVHMTNKPFPNKRPDLVWHSIIPGVSTIECLTKAISRINQEFKEYWDGQDYEYDNDKV